MSIRSVLKMPEDKNFGELNQLNRKNQMRKNRAIESAEIVTAFRALAAYETENCLRNPDYLSMKFLSIKYKAYLLLTRLLGKIGTWWIEKTAPGAYWFFNARSKHFDKVLIDAVNQGVEQIVILGAGYDTRAYRFSDNLSAVQVFELDYPGTQIRKKEKLRKIYGALPQHVIYVPIDFNKEMIEKALVNNGYNSHKTTLFVWEGVSYYLTGQAVDQVLGLISKHSPQGSSIVFDYAIQSYINGDESTYGAKKMIHHVKKLNEPHVFGIKDGATEEFLESRGLTLLTDIGPKEIELAYATGKENKQKGHVYGFLRIAHASV